jgi:hypothetical protein
VPRAGAPRAPARTSVAEKEKETPVFRILTSIVLTLCFASAALAQKKGRSRAEEARNKAQAAQDSQEAQTREMLQKAAQSADAKKLQVSVHNYVDASAVLIPARDASHIFGPQIGRHYAVVEINVGNKSPDATLVIHSIFIDYTRWGLSGVVPGDGQPQGDAQGPFDQYQSSTDSAQVASEEYRVVRGQFLNAQTWRKRSWTMRLLTLAGNVAGAYTFSLNEQGFIKGIAAFNGVVVPGINTAWPDTSQDQMDRINDLGFRTNKIVPKQASEVIVCFFPIERFLTPGFRTLFLKAPSLFFAPGLLLADKTMEPDITKVLGDDLDMPPAALGTTEGHVLPTLKAYLPCYLSILKDARPDLLSKNESYYEQMKADEIGVCLSKFGLTQELDENNRPTGVLKPPPANLGTHPGFAAFMALDYLSQASLNRVHVTIDGSMTVDTSTLAAKIDSVSFDAVAGCAGPEAPCFWSPVVAGGVRTGTISGSYMTDGKVSITGSGDVKVTDVTTISEGSSDQQLRFSFKLTQGASNGTLTFKVSKQPRGSDKPIDSEPFVYSLSGGNGNSGLPPFHPSVTNVNVKDDTTLSVEGSDFFDTPTYHLVVTLVAPDGKEVTVEPSSVTIKDDKHLEVKIPSGADAPGCWKVTATVNGTLAGQPPKNNTFAVLPTVSSATRDGDKVVVEGEGLAAKDCRGNAPTFQLVNEGQPAITLKAKPGSTDAEAAFDLTTAAAKKADTKSKVVVQFAGQKVERQMDVKTQP